MFRLSVCLLVAAGLSACDQTSTSTSSSAPDSEEDRLHARILQAYTGYPSLNGPKVMSGCISNQRGRSPQIKVHNVFSWYTDQSSDMPIFSGRLGRKALQSCQGWAAAENVDCTCVIVDNSGSNVLDLSEVPVTGPAKGASVSDPKTDKKRKPSS